jgi:hypothetical protein
MIDDTRRFAGVDQLIWLHSNVLQYDESNTLDLVVDNVPQCFNEIRRLIVRHNQGIRKKIKTLKDHLKLLDKSQNLRWDNFALTLSKHFRGEVINDSDKALVNYFREQEDNVERSNRICRKKWKSLKFIKEKLTLQIQQVPSVEVGWNKISQKILAVNRLLMKCTINMGEKYQDEITTVLDAMERVIMDSTREFDSDPNQAELFNRENRIIERIDFFYQRMFGFLINGQINGATSGCFETLIAGSVDLINFIEDVKNGADARMAF